MKAIQQKILQLIEEGRAFAVATVAEAKGSVPGKQGAKMILLPDGTQFGTVGGAGLEQKVKGLCRKAFEEKKGGLSSFDLMYYKEGALDSLCGGSVQVLVEYMAPIPHILLAGGRSLVPEPPRRYPDAAHGAGIDDAIDLGAPGRFEQIFRPPYVRVEQFLRMSRP